MRPVVVIGAGAAGAMAAIFSATAGAETILLERTTDGGRKILISGGGRCNILPATVDEARFVTDSSPHTLRRILRTWPLEAQIQFFENEVGIPLVEEPQSAKLFPTSQKARDVRDKLLAFARLKGVQVLGNALVNDFAPSDGGWTVKREDGDPLAARAVIVATGGLSVPNTGSDGRGMRIVERLGHTVHATYPALTPLTAQNDGASPFGRLAGISLPVTIRAESGSLKAGAAGGFLFTHRGYSGPAVLDISHVPVRSLDAESVPARVTVRWTRLGAEEWNERLRLRGSKTVVAQLASEMPHRLAEAILDEAHIERDEVLSQLTRRDRVRLIDLLVQTPLPWNGHEGYKKAEVTGGGVSLAEIDPQTMESRRHRGLFLCGEMLDAFGPIGGYNFLWAWATGRAAGIAAAKVS